MLNCLLFVNLNCHLSQKVMFDHLMQLRLFEYKMEVAVGKYLCDLLDVEHRQLLCQYNQHHRRRY